MQKHPSQIVTLEDVLDAREQRAQIQAELRAAYGAPVVSITVNMPGNIKYSEETVSLVYRALAKV
ncbi:MAG: citrate lyase holo-[acyl-carrier protein] synthase, partial [Negativicutes bacterium]|nr:citrate lyase holo-[acyl-carrier protein] synthase [Negativicutes bacterium]